MYFYFIQSTGIDRYIAICHAFSKTLQKLRKRASAQIMNFIIWIISTFKLWKLEVKGSILNIVSAYAPQVNNSMEEKNNFWEDLDGLIESISKEERTVLGADINGHVGEGNIEDEEIMGRYGAGTRNKEGSMAVDFGKGWIWLLSILISKRKMNTG